MRVPAKVYQMERCLAAHLPSLRPAERQVLALWVYGTMMAQSVCQSAVVGALLLYGSAAALRQRLREWLYDSPDKRGQARQQVAVRRCFGGLMGWVLSQWQGQELALAIDATLHGDRVVALVVSVLYRGSAIPVAWAILPANTPGGWREPIEGLLRPLRAVVPSTMTVVVLTDRGLWSPRLWRRIRHLGWHPLMRVQKHITFAPEGRDRGPAQGLVRPGQGWIGRGRLGSPKKPRLPVTLIAIWLNEQREPWIVVTDLAPAAVGVSGYALRMWIELGFRVLKGVGWQWQRTRRTDPERVARLWLILAVATVWTLAYGTRMEEAQRLGRDPARLNTPPVAIVPQRPRWISVFRLGVQVLRQLLPAGRWWPRLWLTPQPWPEPPDDLELTIQGAT